MERLRILSNLWNVELDSVDSTSLSSKISKAHRISVLKWLFESLDLLKVDDSVFFSTVMLSDRYCSRAPVRRRLEGADLQLVILAGLCCSLKTVDSSIDLSVKAFLEHVSGGHVESKDIFQTEARILEALCFNTFSPPLNVYLESFYEVLWQSTPSGTTPLEQETSRSSLPKVLDEQKQFALLVLYILVLDIERLHAMCPAELISTCILISAHMVRSDKWDIKTIELGLFEAGWLGTDVDVSSVVMDTASYIKASMANPSEAVEAVLRIFGSKERLNVAKLSVSAARLVTSGG
jgi:hypothetical protein